MNTRDNVPPARSDQREAGGGCGSPRGDDSPRRVIDWSAVAEFLVGSVMIIGGYLFIVLILGLTGGMFGGFVDVVLSFVDERWVGQGRQCGWILGAVVAAIGLLLGRVRSDDKKFSFPAPRKLWKNIANRLSKRRLKKTEQPKSASGSYKVRSLADVVNGVALIGGVSALLGFLLGMCLAMCWLSLAMSPFAPGGWFDAIGFASTSLSHGGVGMGVSTSHPIAIALVLVLTLGLGTVGLVGGTIYGLFAYAHYLKTVPPDTRARHRREKRETLRGKSLPRGLLVLGIVFALLGGSLAVWATTVLIQGTASQSWPQVSGRIIESKLELWEDSEGGQSYSGSVSYEYEVDRTRYTGDRISFGDYAGGSCRYQPGSEVQVYHDPNRPERSVLEPGWPQGIFVPLVFGALFLLGGIFAVFSWIEPFMANRRRGNEE